MSIGTKIRSLGYVRRGREVRTMTTAEVAERLGDPDFHILDANLEVLFRRERIPGARRVAFDSLAPEDLPAVTDRATLLFYCHNSF